MNDKLSESRRRLKQATDYKQIPADETKARYMKSFMLLCDKEMNQLPGNSGSSAEVKLLAFRYKYTNIKIPLFHIFTTSKTWMLSRSDYFQVSK